MIITGQLVRIDRSSNVAESQRGSAEQRNAVRIIPGYLRIEGNRIAEVVEGEISERADLGGPDYLICPGFIDTHLHLPQFDMIGSHGLPLLQWLDEVTFPSERRWEDPDYARTMTNRVIDQCFAHGTTSICAYATVHHSGAVAALEVAQQRNVRGVIGQVLMDRQAPDYLLRPAQLQIDETRRLLDRFPPGASLAAAVTPRFAVSCTGELMNAAGELAKERDAVIQTHLAETLQECDLVQNLFGGVSYTDLYRDAGLLTPRSIFGHGIYLDSSDCKKIADADSIIAHCPTANSFLRSGTMNRAALLQSSVKLALGSDIGAGYERSMIRVARAMIEAASSLGESFPSAAEALWQITHGNALALGWPDRDRFSSDEQADVLVIQPNVVWLYGEVDPLSKLMFSWDDRWLKTTIVAGEASYSST